ncbi:MAG TPA: MBL fold metallo-hydrolase [Clostridiales bacterium]|nr:MBL fold metallo-hydrolase [Clostridiales bacterium]
MSKSKNYKSLRTVVVTLLIVFVLIMNQYGSARDKETSSTSLPSGVIEVHFIDVGQGDSILIETKDSAMLIDAGENDKGIDVVNYLQLQNIQKLDYLVGTHPHSDHIGGLDDVLNSFPVDKVLLPDVANNTATFEEVLDTLDKKNLKITKTEVGDQYSFGDATFTILSPASPYDDMNDNSLVIKLNFGKNSFLFTGDAEKPAEIDMLAGAFDLSADVLKIGHHGSESSTSRDFLAAVNPTYAVICVGTNNDYGHPKEETLRRIKEQGVKLYRTDMQGTIVFTSNGKNISVNTKDYDITDEDLED